MKNELRKEFNYSPPQNTDIRQIYPWLSPLKDLFDVFFYDRESVLKKVSKYFPTNKSILVNSGRAAILLTLKSLHLERSDEVILSTFNCKAVIDPVIAYGLTPVLIDCDENGRLSINELKKHITTRTRLVILSNIYGILDDYKKVTNIVRFKKVKVIMDICQSLVLPTKEFDQFISVYSFGAEKHLYALGGGAIFSNDTRFIKRAKHFLGERQVTKTELLGEFISRCKYYLTFFIYSRFAQLANFFSKIGVINKFERSKNVSGEKIENIEVKKMNISQVKIVARKLLDLNMIIKRNTQNFKYLSRKINNHKIELITGKFLNPLYFSIKVKDRSSLGAYLSNNGISSVWNYIPLHMFPVYRKYGRGDLKNSEKIWKEVLSIPFNYALSKKVLNKGATILTNYTHD